MFALFIVTSAIDMCQVWELSPIINKRSIILWATQSWERNMFEYSLSSCNEWSDLNYYNTFELNKGHVWHGWRLGHVVIHLMYVHNPSILKCFCWLITCAHVRQTLRTFNKYNLVLCLWHFLQFNWLRFQWDFTLVSTHWLLWFVT